MMMMMIMSLLGREDEGGRLNSWRHCGGTFLTFSPSHPPSNSHTLPPLLFLSRYIIVRTRGSSFPSSNDKRLSKVAHGHGLNILSLGGGAPEPPRLIWSYSVEEMSRTVKGGFSIVSLAGNGPFLGEVYRECRGTAMDRPLIPPGTDSI